VYDMKLVVGAKNFGNQFEFANLTFLLDAVRGDKAHVFVFQGMQANEPVAYQAGLRAPLQDEREKRRVDRAALATTCQETEALLCRADQAGEDREGMFQTWRNLVECRRNHDAKVAQLTQELDGMPFVGRPVFAIRGQSYWVTLERRFTIVYNDMKIMFMIMDPSADPDDVLKPVTLNPREVQNQLEEQQLGGVVHADFCDRFKDGSERPVAWKHSMEAYTGEPENMEASQTRKRRRSPGSKESGAAKRQS